MEIIPGEMRCDVQPYRPAFPGQPDSDDSEVPSTAPGSFVCPREPVMLDHSSGFFNLTCQTGRVYTNSESITVPPIVVHRVPGAQEHSMIKSVQENDNLKAVENLQGHRISLSNFCFVAQHPFPFLW